MISQVDTYSDGEESPRSDVKTEEGIDISKYLDCNIHDLIREKKTKIAATLIKDNHFNDVDEVDKEGNTYLLVAAKMRYSKIVRLLIEKKGDVNKQNDAGEVPLQVAIKSKDFETAKALIEAGAKYEDLIASMMRCRELSDAFILDRIRDLLRKGRSVEPCIFSAVDSGRIKIIDRLLEQGVDVNAVDSSGTSLIFRACEKCKWHVAKLLVERGGDMNTKDPCRKQHLIFYAFERGNHNFIQFLIEKGANLEVKDEKGQTPLFVAVQKGYMDTISLLLEKGVDLDAEDANGTPLLIYMICMESHHFENNEKYQLAKKFIEKKVDVNAKDCEGKSALAYAVKQCNFLLVQLLIGNMADVNVEGTSKQALIFDSVFHDKSRIDVSYNVNFLGYRLDLLKQFILGGVYVNVVCTRTGVTPLHLVCRAFKEESEEKHCEVYEKMFDLLLKNGTDVTIRDKWGKTPRDILYYYPFMQKSTAHVRMYYQLKEKETKKDG